MSTLAKVTSASCLCKAVQYEATGEPFRSVLCHCNNCKKSSGSAFMAHACWNSDLKITQGESSIRHYSDNDTESGNTLIRSFCANCGSPLFAKTPARGDFIIAHTGAFEGHQSWVPKEEVHSGSRAEWLKDIAFETK